MDWDSNNQMQSKTEYWEDGNITIPNEYLPTMKGNETVVICIPISSQTGNPNDREYEAVLLPEAGKDIPTDFVTVENISTVVLDQLNSCKDWQQNEDISTPISQSPDIIEEATGNFKWSTLTCLIKRGRVRQLL